MTESEYLDVWNQVSAQSPAELAIVGGQVAPAPAWLFIAGYQAAVRWTFPQTEFEGWTALAVSEDREGNLPGLTTAPGEEGVVLSGWKTWVAASRSVSSVVVSARLTGADAEGQAPEFYLLHPNMPGLSMDHRDNPSMLPDLSQGRLCCDQVVVGAPLDGSRVKQFAKVEGLMVLLAFLAYAEKSALLEQGVAFLDRLDDRDGLDAFRLSTLELIEAQADQESGDAAGVWARDQQLLKMYATPRKRKG